MAKILLRLSDEEKARIESAKGELSINSFILNCVNSVLDGVAISIPTDERVIPGGGVADSELTTKCPEVLTRIDDLEGALMEAITDLGGKLDNLGKSGWTNGSENKKSFDLGVSQRLAVKKPVRLGQIGNVLDKIAGDGFPSGDGGLRQAVERWYARKMGKPEFEEWNNQGLTAIENEYRTALALGKTADDYYVEEEVAEPEVEPVDLEELHKKIEDLEEMESSGLLMRAKDLKPITKEGQLKWAGKKK